MRPRLSILYTLYSILIILVGSATASAQKFSVESFRVLPNDVSAFIDPVKDLNGDDCALIKVMAGPDFAFSSPLGIIKRVDNVGEIWLYIPRRSRTLTLKHPRWGVMRDYRFPEKIESHLTYELRVAEPAQAVTAPAPERIVTTVRDTLIISRTDTLLIAPVRKVYPLQFLAGATVTYGGNSRTLVPGVMVALMKKHGGYIHAVTDFGSIGSTVGSCDRYGAMDGRTPFYSGSERHSFVLATAGALQRLSGRLSIFEGVGYGSTATAWELAASEGGGYVRNTRYSTRGLALEAGVNVRIGRVAVTASASTIRTKQWYGSLGISYVIGKTK